MPYFDTLRGRDPFPSSNGAGFDRISYKTLAFETGYRTSPPVDSIYAAEVSSSVADPYAWFIEDNRDLTVGALAKRGFDTSVIRRDRGHTWDKTSFEYLGNLYDYTDRVSAVAPLVTKIGQTMHPGTWALASYSGFTVPSGPNLSQFAISRYAKAATSGQVVDLANVLGELREGLPHVLPDLIKRIVSFESRARRVLKSAGSDYLNVQFGWIPLLNDIQAVVKVLALASAGFTQPTDPVHRLYQTEPTHTTVFPLVSSGMVSITPYTGHNMPDLPVQYRGAMTAAAGGYTGVRNVNALSGKVYLSETTKQKLWFEGEFLFVPKPGFNPKSFTDRAEALVNLDITPAVLWNLSPWSWLVDWALHIGEALIALESVQNDRVISSYAYAMAETTIVRTMIATDVTSNLMAYSGPKEVLSVWKSTRKQRIRANPYGFTLGTNFGLNAGQLGILGALGLTKSR